MNSTKIINYIIIEDIFGYITTFLIVIRLCPQIVKIFKTKKTNDISLLFLFIGIISKFTALTYGILIYQWPMIIKTILTSIQLIIILIAKLYYDNKNKKKLINNNELNNNLI